MSRPSASLRNRLRRAPLGEDVASPRTDGRALATMTAAWVLIALLLAVAVILVLHAV